MKLEIQKNNQLNYQLGNQTRCVPWYQLWERIKFLIKEPSRSCSVNLLSDQLEKIK